MYNGKFTSIDEIIEKVSRFGFSDFDIVDAKEWTWDILNRLGVPSIYIKKKALITVENGRCFIPNDCADLTESQLRDFYSGIVIRKSTDTFFPSDEEKVGEEGTYVYREIGKSVVYDADGNLVDDAEAYLAVYPPIVQTFKTLSYQVNNSQFIFGFDSGIVELSYAAFPINSNGDPMIPDNAKCIDAVVWHIIRMIAFRMNIQDLLSDRKLANIEKKSMFKNSSARSAMNLETVDDWENVSANWMKLRRDINQREIGYKTLGNREHLNF